VKAHVDIAGRPVEIGNVVVTANVARNFGTTWYGYLKIGTVVKFTEKSIRVATFDGRTVYATSVCILPDDVAVLAKLTS
jgi:hypothetical protein